MTGTRRLRHLFVASILPLILSTGVNLATVCADDAAAEESTQAAADVLDAAGVSGGLIIHVGCGDGKLTAALRIDDSYQVHGIDRDAANVSKARDHIRSKGLYGDVSVDRLVGKQLPYIDNMANLVVSADLGDVSMDEVMRVLVPNGVAYIKQSDAWKRTVKPRPKNIDEWTHYMHDASGNAVAHDDVVGPPRHLQWIGSPRWSRHHDRMASMSALVSGGGRIFYIMDEGSRMSIQLPPDWKLVARDAFNGKILWKQSIKTWHSHLWPLKSGPTQLARRLITTGDRVYVTLGLRVPLTEIDAATGKILRTFEGSESTEEVITVGGVLYVLVNKGESELTSYAPQLNVGDQQRVAREFRWNEQPRQIMSIDIKSGRTLWTKESRVSPLTLAADGTRVYFHDGEKAVCLYGTTGKKLWNSPPTTRRAAITMNFGPKLVVYEDVVLYAGGDRKMKAFAADTGKQLWQAPHAQSGYASPEDVLVAGGLVWNAPTTRTQDSGVFTGRDPRTGVAKVEFPPDVNTYWFHHRCYMAKATDKFLLPSRTGIEFVDPSKKHWDIHHWVRGGCLYGIMPCNGLVYAPPHNCACYPEVKLYGFNVLAPKSPSRQSLLKINDDYRLQHGPAYSAIQKVKLHAPQASDWPIHRHDAARSGSTKHAVPTAVKQAWQVELGGRLTAPTIADGKLFVAQIDQHMLHAFDAQSGDKLWSYSAGGRVDSPPTIWAFTLVANGEAGKNPSDGLCLFGSADGHVYCLRASDGELVWRYRAAPQDRRLLAFEQLESIWPVHGSVLIVDEPSAAKSNDNGESAKRQTVACFVAGRSNFLDGGLRWFKLDVQTGRPLAEVVIDDRDPESKKNLQVRTQILNMPVGLPDILSSDGRHIYMRSQRFDFNGKRLAVGPHSGQPAEQGSVQRGDGSHLFAPMGFLDDTWFHRSYWVYGRSFAGGHSGYYQAGKYTPSGRILVADADNVYGFGRKPQYYRWTTTIEHQLFASSKTPPDEARDSIGAATARQAVRRGLGGSMVRFEKTKSLDPTGKLLAVEAWIKAERPNGVIVARGGPSRGYALIMKGGRPQFMVRNTEASLSVVTAVSLKAVAKKKNNAGYVGRWVHLVGTLTDKNKVEIYVNGKLSASAKAAGPLSSDPVQSLEIGGDDQGAVGAYKSPNGFTGAIDEVRVYHGMLNADEIAARSQAKQDGSEPGKAKNATLVLAVSFEKGQAKDASGNNNDGKIAGAKRVAGQVGDALRFTGTAGGSRSGGSFVKHHWNQDLPLFVRAMVKAGDTLFVAGPADVLDEEQSFSQLVNRDPKIQIKLKQQADILDGKKGALLQAISSADGSKLAEFKLQSLPVWDGLAAANGRLYLSTTNGQIVCFGE